ncbi:MAG: hypothetical protein IKW34_04630 [Clostridia bacterium]|nr:hypothetical protein [Clostridia bacterium]
MKKILSTALAILLIISSVSIIASAYSETPKLYTAYDGDYIFDKFYSSEVYSDSAIANPVYAGTTDKDTPYRFYDQLDTLQKFFYDMFLSAGVQNTFTVTFEDYETVVGIGATMSDAVANAKALIREIVVGAVTAVTEDNPMLFWYYGYGYSFSYYQGTDANGNAACLIAEITITINIDKNSYTDMNDVANKYNQLAIAVNEFEVNGISRYEKVKSINDSLCDMITYPEVQGYFSDGSPFYGPMAHQPTGALLNGSAVCEGYAEAFKLICDREGIPCITVLGYAEYPNQGHKWNYVKMDDGKWYLVDATWNDQESSTFYSYFLIGEDSKTPYYGYSSVPDSSIHVDDGQMYPDAVFTLQYPSLDKGIYMETYLEPNVKDMAFDNTRNCLLVGKGIYYYEDYIYTGGTYSYSKSGSGVTGTTITTTDGTNSVTYTVAMRGDINDTDTVTTDDYNLVVSTAGAKNKVTQNTAKFYAGDMTQDGAIDGFDAIALDLYLKGTLKFD